ncbi:hypothetical protein Clacol_008592 [Clathrus columnatus]|uniref:Uncharacterized protein n=1 Tax=Clathrus columnatus TaxID=1419009 RepID=A0AAV5ALI2_9AGAM|nr:hypothetical protein Clacol_008592 [Clathrus columnatus]
MSLSPSAIVIQDEQDVPLPSVANKLAEWHGFSTEDSLATSSDKTNNRQILKWRQTIARAEGNFGHSALSDIRDALFAEIKKSWDEIVAVDLNGNFKRTDRAANSSRTRPSPYDKADVRKLSPGQKDHDTLDSTWTMVM